MTTCGMHLPPAPLAVPPKHAPPQQDPRIDPKKARRIMANRLSAAKVSSAAEMTGRGFGRYRMHALSLLPVAAAAWRWTGRWCRIAPCDPLTCACPPLLPQSKLKNKSTKQVGSCCTFL